MPIASKLLSAFEALLLSLAVGLPLLVTPAAQAQTAGPAAAASAAASAAADLDAAVLKRLAEVGSYLRAQKNFSVKAEALTDEVLLSGQKLQFSSSVDYLVSAPDKMRVSVHSDRRDRDFYFDGKSLTLVGLRAGYYAVVPLPGTIAENLGRIAERYEIELPLADLFFWGTPSAGLEEVTAAMLVGPARINGVACDHFALRQAGVDWQVWVARGARAVPLKLVITTTDEPAQPQYAATLKWTLGTAPAASSFVYVPAKGMSRIELKSVAAAK